MIDTLIFDLDGTLLSNEASILPRTREVIERLQAQGVEVVIATGRSTEAARFLLGDFINDKYLVTLNGAAVFDRHHNTMSSTFIAEESARKLLAIARRFPHIQFHAYSEGGGLYVETTSNESKIYGDRSGLECQVVNFDNIDPLHWYKGIFFSQTHEILKPLGDAVEQTLSDVVNPVYSMPEYFEVLPAGISKASGMRTVFAELGHSFENAMAFGDGLNDLEILKAVGHPVAMISGNKRLLSKGFHTTRFGNDDDGIADYLENLPQTLFTK